MDALRRAEAEKKQQDAARTKDDSPAEQGSDSSQPQPADLPGQEEETVVSGAANVPATEDDPGLVTRTTTMQSTRVGSEDITMQIPASALSDQEQPTVVSGAETRDDVEPESLTATMTSDEPVSTGDDAVDLNQADNIEQPEVGDMSLSMSFSTLELEPIEGAGDVSETADTSDTNEAAPDEDVEATISLEETHGEGLALEQIAGDVTSGTATGERIHQEQTATMPSSRAVQNDLNAYFDQSQSMEMPRGRLNGDLTLEDVASHTVVGASTVFSAGERPQSRRIWIVAAILGLCGVVVIGVAAFYYWQKSPGALQVPSPQVADGVERAQSRELPIVPVESATSLATSEATSGEAELVRIDTEIAGSISGTLEESSQDNSSIAQAGQTSGAEAPDISHSGQALTDIGDGDLNPATEAEFVTEDADMTAPDTGTGEADLVQSSPGESQAADSLTAATGELLSPADVEPVVPDAYPEPAEGIGAGQVLISKAPRRTTVKRSIAEGFAAYSRGDYESAEAFYRAALADDPDQRDALLGLGAVAVETGNTADAYANYARVLRIFPGDPVAAAALFNLTGEGGESTAAKLRVLLDEHSDVAFVHFALGNWYARQSRWADAQQAYFDAVTREADNADYHYNLAISLDRMGKRAAAVEYYQKSLEYAANGSGTFDTASVAQRIAGLAAPSGNR